MAEDVGSRGVGFASIRRLGVINGCDLITSCGVHERSHGPRDGSSMQIKKLVA